MQLKQQVITKKNLCHGYSWSSLVMLPRMVIIVILCCHGRLSWLRLGYIVLSVTQTVVMNVCRPCDATWVVIMTQSHHMNARISRKFAFWQGQFCQHIDSALWRECCCERVTENRCNTEECVKLLSVRFESCKERDRVNESDILKPFHAPRIDRQGGFPELITEGMWPCGTSSRSVTHISKNTLQWPDSSLWSFATRHSLSLHPHSFSTLLIMNAKQWSRYILSN